MSSLIFDGQNHTIEILDNHKRSLGKWTAYNNIDHAFARKKYHSHYHLNNGLYTVQDRHAPHSHPANANGPYGSYGIIRFNYPGHSGIGLHSGRKNSKHMPGPQHATHGCIRTTDEAMAAIRRIMTKDSLKTIQIKGNNEHTVKHGEHKQSMRHHHSHQQHYPHSHSQHRFHNHTHRHNSSHTDVFNDHIFTQWA